MSVVLSVFLTGFAFHAFDKWVFHDADEVTEQQGGKSKNNNDNEDLTEDGNNTPKTEVKAPGENLKNRPVPSTRPVPAKTGAVNRGHGYDLIKP